MIEAVQHVRRMRGGTQSHMMRCDDGHFYVVKFQTNPQHPRALANDLFGTRLADSLGIPVPKTEIVFVDKWLVEHTSQLNFTCTSGPVPCDAGIQFGSQYAIDPTKGEVFDYLPDTMMGAVRNVCDFAGALVFDKWTCNSDLRQAAFWRKSREKKFTAIFIDQGYCFNAQEWNFPDAPLRGVFIRNDVYWGITGWESFEPWITSVEQMSVDMIAHCAEGIPPEWYGHDADGLSSLIEQLSHRRTHVRRLILEFGKSSRMPFPNWRQSSHGAVPVTWGYRKVACAHA